jgi:hypothetical protein
MSSIAALQPSASSMSRNVSAPRSGRVRDCRNAGRWRIRVPCRSAIRRRSPRSGAGRHVGSACPSAASTDARQGIPFAAGRQRAVTSVRRQPSGQSARDTCRRQSRYSETDCVPPAGLVHRPLTHCCTRLLRLRSGVENGGCGRHPAGVAAGPSSYGQSAAAAGVWSKASVACFRRCSRPAMTRS